MGVRGSCIFIGRSFIGPHRLMMRHKLIVWPTTVKCISQYLGPSALQVLVTFMAPPSERSLMEVPADDGQANQKAITYEQEKREGDQHGPRMLMIYYNWMLTKENQF